MNSIESYVHTVCSIDWTQYNHLTILHTHVRTHTHTYIRTPKFLTHTFTLTLMHVLCLCTHAHNTCIRQATALWWCLLTDERVSLESNVNKGASLTEKSLEHLLLMIIIVPWQRLVEPHLQHVHHIVRVTRQRAQRNPTQNRMQIIHYTYVSRHRMYIHSRYGTVSRWHI